MRRASSILKALSPEGRASARAKSAARREGLAARRRAHESGFGFAGPPGFGGDSAERDPRLADQSVIEAQRRRSGDNRESEGRAFAQLEIAGVVGKGGGSGGEPQRHDKLAGLQRRRASRVRTGQTMQGVDRNLPTPLRAFHFRDRVQRDEGHGKVGGMGRDTMLAPAEHRMQTVLAPSRVAAGAWPAAVAGACHVMEIGAARLLHQIAADRRRIAKLRRGARQQRLRDGGVGSREALVVGEIGISDHRADAHAAVVEPFDAVETGQAPDVDKAGGARHPDLHQIDEIRAAGEKSRARLGGGRHCLGDGRRPDVIEPIHAASFRLPSAITLCASSTASVMP